MVKRQTVWLSTMMVLSLMLIGYYTMNNEPGQTAAGSDATSTITPDTSGTSSDTSGTSSATGDTSKTNKDTNNGKDSSTSDKNTQSTTTSTTTAASSSDWYVKYQTELEQTMDQQMDTYAKVLTNANASEDQLSQAEQQLTRLQDIKGAIGSAHDRVLAQGFKDCVVVPNKDYTKFTVYVKSDNKLTAAQAVQIMHIVSQQLNISAVNVSVSQHA